MWAILSYWPNNQLKYGDVSADKFCMKKILLLSFLISCAQEPLRPQKPYWVEAIRSGEEALRVSNGQKTFYRRIAGSPDLTKQTSCNLVIMKAEEDLRKEFPDSKVPYAVEVLFYDEEHKDCAVTISTTKVPERSVASVPSVSSDEEEASSLINKRSENAAKFALTGLTKTEFEKFAQDKVQIFEEKNLCTKFFRTQSFSIHGLTHVCWKGDVVAGYCTLKDKQCWTRTP